MKTRPIIVVILAINLAAFDTFAQTWPKYYSHENMDDIPHDLIETYDKGYIICGNFNYYYDDVKQWSWLIKTDINGNILWDKIINAEEEYVSTNAVDPTDDGGVLTCGSIYSYIDGMWYPYAMKLDACGNKEWCKIFTGTSSLSTFSKDILELPSGEIVVLVDQWEVNEAVHLFNLSASGELLWMNGYCKKTDYPKSDSPYGNSLTLTSDGNILITGDVYWENPWGPPGLVWHRSCFIMVDDCGNEKWVLPFGLQDTIYGEAFRSYGISSNYFIASGANWTDKVHPLFISFDQNGNIFDYKKLFSNEIDPSFIQCVLPDLFKIGNKFYFGGAIENNTSPEYYFPTVHMVSDTSIFNPFFHFQQVNVLEDSYDPTTNALSFDHKLLNSSTYKETGLSDIILSKLNLNLEYDTAYNSVYTYDSLCTSGPPQSGFIYLAECDIVTGIDAPTPKQYYESLKTIHIKVFPNPASDILNLEFDNAAHHQNLQLRCYNMHGILVHCDLLITGQKGAAINISGWPPGMYVALVTGIGGASGKCKFVVEKKE